MTTLICLRANVGVIKFTAYLLQLFIIDALVHGFKILVDKMVHLVVHECNLIWDYASSPKSALH